MIVALLGGFGVMFLGALLIVVAIRLVPPLKEPAYLSADSELQAREELESLRQVILQLRLELSDSRRETERLALLHIRGADARTSELRLRQLRERDEPPLHEHGADEDADPPVAFPLQQIALHS